MKHYRSNRILNWVFIFETYFKQYQQVIHILHKLDILVHKKCIVWQEIEYLNTIKYQIERRISMIFQRYFSVITKFSSNVLFLISVNFTLPIFYLLCFTSLDKC